jgi:hypothetical protein
MLLQALQAEPRFDAPKAQLARIVIRGLLDELLSRGPVQATLVILSLLAFFQGVPILIAWDFAKGAGRRKWVWVTSAALASWLVLPVLWIVSSRSRDAESN